MIPYLLVFLLAASAFIFYKWFKTDIPFYILLLVLVVFSGFRDMIGGFDVYIYAEVYEYRNNLIILIFPYFEIGFRLLYIALRSINEKREFMFFCMALLILCLHFITIKKHSKLLYFSIFIYFCKFYLFTFIYLRQGLAMGIIWFSIPFILEKKYFKSLIIFSIAFCFHKSSLIFLPLLFIANRRLTGIQLISGIFLFLIVFISPLNQLISSSLASAADSEKLAGYSKKNSSVNVFYLVELSLFSWLAIAFRKFFYKTDKGKLIYNGFILYILFSIVGLTNATFVRLTWYYFIFVVLALPYMYHYLRDVPFKRFFKTMIFAYYSAIFIRLLITYDNGDLMPYKSIFQNFQRNGLWEHMEYRKNK